MPNACLIPFEKMMSLRQRAAVANFQADLFKSIRAPRPVQSRPDSIQNQLSERHEAAVNQLIETKDIENRYPERFWFAPSLYDPTDPGFDYRIRIKKQSFYSLPLKRDETHIEFVDRSLISPEKWQSLKDLAKLQRVKRERREKYNKRLEISKVKRVRLAGRLGNIGNNFDSQEKPVRAKRYHIQRFIQKNGLSKSQYVCNCGVNIADYVHLKKNQEHGNVNFAGVATCGSVWACPVCRNKIINRRETDLKTIYKNGVAAGYHFHLVTLTFRHSKKDNLAELYGSSSLRKGLSGALTRFRQSRVWSKEFKPAVGFVGDVRGIEITWGEQSGFHPHVHMIIISKKDFNAAAWEKKFLRSWKDYCQKSGIGVPNQRGVKVEKVTEERQVAYLAKWSTANELSSQDGKQAKNGNFSIAELEFCLVDQAYRGLKQVTTQRAADVLRAYYAAMEGQKMLVFGGLNTGWKKELLPDDLPDDQEITSEEYQARFESQLCMIHKSVYKTARRSGILNSLVEKIEKIQEKDGNLHSVKVTSLVKQHFKKNKIPVKNLIFGRTTFRNEFQ